MEEAQEYIRVTDKLAHRLLIYMACLLLSSAIVVSGMMTLRLDIEKARHEARENACLIIASTPNTYPPAGYCEGFFHGE